LRKIYQAGLCLAPGMARAGSNGWIEYGERMERVTAYVFNHLDDDLDLNKLAEVACLSPYHWHRIYHAMRGETIAATVRRLRLHRATGWLANSDMPIEEIAAKSGFGGVESFTRIFKAAYGMPPAKYRREGSHRRFDPQTKETVMQHVEIRTLPPMRRPLFRTAAPTWRSDALTRRCSAPSARGSAGAGPAHVRHLLRRSGLGG
jgi:AraC-like DNA-binding protein